LKILFILPEVGVGGTEKQVALLANQLKLNSLDCEVHFLRSGTSHIGQQISNCIWNFPKNPLSLEYLSKVFQLKKYIQRGKFDIVHAFLPEPVIITQLLCNFKETKTKYVSGVRGEHISKRRFFIAHLLYKHSLRKSSAVICNSPSLLKYVEEKFSVPPRMIYYISNGLVQKFEINPRQISCKTTAIVISNFHPYKGFKLLFQAFHFVKSNLVVHFFGSGMQSINARTLISDLPKNISIVLHGQSDPELVLTDVSFAIHPSTTEGQSNAILEELGNGLPVIAFEVGGNGTLLQDHYNGLLIKTLDPASLAVAIDKLCGDEILCAQLSQNAFDSSKAYSPSKLLKNHLEIYKQILSN
jgi:glycosyltransferase involved in cell wall biosynthesis